jgi:hypothetical protein
MMRLEKPETSSSRVEQATSLVPKRNEFFRRFVGIEPRAGLGFFRSGIHHPVAAWWSGE